jgi:hypothetical protein
MSRHLLLGLVLVTGCAPPPSQHLGAATPIPVEADPSGIEKKRFPKEGLQTRYTLTQRDPCGARCLYARDGAASLRLDMHDDGSASAEDRGALRERFRSVAGNTDELVEWTRRYSGRWTKGGGKLLVELDPSELACRRVTKEGESEAPCDTASLALQCSIVEVVLERPSTTETSWVCEQKKKPMAKDTFTPFPWVFGMQRPLVAGDLGSVQSPQRAYWVNRARVHQDVTKR